MVVELAYGTDYGVRGRFVSKTAFHVAQGAMHE